MSTREAEISDGVLKWQGRLNVDLDNHRSQVGYKEVQGKKGVQGTEASQHPASRLLSNPSPRD